jgi:hypothetical protein
VTQPVTFTATGTAGPAATVSAHAGNNQSAPVGSAVPTRPAARVVDQYGNPKSGVTVTFAVASGGGGATATTATTDAEGIATVGSWTLGTAAGTNTLTATVAGLTAVTFTATGVPLAPASLTKQAGDNQTARPGTNVPVAPSVLVRDQHNNPVLNATVTFAVASGGGSVTGGTATTDASGVATVGSWRLGNTPGTNTLTASVSGVAAVTFTATGLDPCTSTALDVPASVNGELTTADCQLSPGDFADRYSITLGAASALTLSLNSTAFDPLEVLVDPQENIVAYNDDRAGEDNLNAYIRILAAAGTYTLYATSALPGRTGAYSVSTATATGNVTLCPDEIQNMVWITPGVSTGQRLETSDCNFGTTTPVYADLLAISMVAGRTYTITQTAATYQPFLALYDVTGNPVGEYQDAPGLSRVTFTPTEDDFYVIEASSDVAGVTGAYVLSVGATGTSASATAARAGSASRVLTGRKAPRSSVPTWRSRRAPR